MVVSMPSQEGQTCKEKVSQLHKRFGRALPSLSKDDEVLRYGEEEAKTGCNTISDYRDLQQHRKKEESKKSEEKKSEIRLNIEGSQGKKPTKNKKECKRNTKFKIPKIVPISLIVFGLICQAGTVPVHGKAIGKVAANTDADDGFATVAKESGVNITWKTETRDQIMHAVTKSTLIASYALVHQSAELYSKIDPKLYAASLLENETSQLTIYDCNNVSMVQLVGSNIYSVMKNGVPAVISRDSSSVWIHLNEAPHGAQEVDPETDVPLNRSTETDTDTNEKESEVQDNGLPAWAIALIVIAVILIVAILIAVFVWNHFKKKASHGAQEVNPEEGVLMNTLNETVTGTNGADVSDVDVPNTDAVADEAINDSESVLPETGITSGLVARRVEQFS